MAVSLIVGAQRYSGLSSDTKPTTGVKVGATFYETDTGRTAVYDGAAWDGAGGSATTKTATIANNGSLSGAVDTGNARLIAIVMPEAWTTAVLTFAAAATLAGTYYPVYDDAGVEVTVQAAASRAIGVDLVAGALAPFRFIKIRSGTVGSAVNQGAERVITVLVEA